jgi:putative FmdB family regulatory protein
MCPIYEKYCEKCDKTEEYLLTLSKKDNIIACRDCKNDMTSLVSSGNFKLYGEGVYKPSKKE